MRAVLSILKELRELRALIEERLPPPKKRASSPLKGRKQYGDNGCVRLSEAEYAELDKHWGTIPLSVGIRALDEYLHKTPGKRYKSHKDMLMKYWPAERIQEYIDSTKMQQNKRSLWG